MRTFTNIRVILFTLALQLQAAEPSNPADIARAARGQIGKTVAYDPSYRGLEYPGGDVPIEVGVCTDVVVRALRESLAIDLQRLVHEDMQRDFAQYPQNWGLKVPDKNIDHRRVPNLRTFFKRQGWELTISNKPQDYHPGDLVTCLVPRNLAHIMVVSDHKNADGQPLVIHNIGEGAQEEDRLFEFKITGYYRIKSPESAARED